MTLPQLQKKVRRKKLAKPGQRLRSASHLAWVRKHACCVPLCNSESRIDAHHVTHDGNRGMGRKADDCWVISMCHDHHMAFLAMGRRLFQDLLDLDVAALAKEFASQSPDPAIREAARGMVP